MAEQGYTLRALSKLSGVPARTIRSWIELGLVEPAHGRGPAARHSPITPDRVRAIKAWRDVDRLSLCQIRDLLAAREDAEESRPCSATRAGGDGVALGSSPRELRAAEPDADADLTPSMPARQIRRSMDAEDELGGAFLDPLVQRVLERTVNPLGEIVTCVPVTDGIELVCHGEPADDELKLWVEAARLVRELLEGSSRAEHAIADPGLGDPAEANEPA